MALAVVNMSAAWMFSSFSSRAITSGESSGENFVTFTL